VPSSILALLITIYSGVGVTCLVWPQRLQKMALRQSLGVERTHPRLIILIGSWKYIFFLRAVGVVSVTAALLLLSGMAHHT